jgi:hypothetical protein
VSVRETVGQPDEDDEAPEWTIAIGLRRATFHLLGWSAALFPLWAGLVWLLTPWFNTLPTGRRGGLMWIVFLIAAMCGWVAGRALWSPMLDRAGFVSRLLSLMATLFIAAIAVGGVWVADTYRPLAGERLWLTMIGFFVAAMYDVVMDTLTDF